ncbi:MAG TPA: hypothetical protein VFQ23_16770 [Anaerolineales bacterium]|nr:hypothetical protein [Anaerolineales bacterium]
MKLTELFAELKSQLDSDPSTLRKAMIWGREDLLGGAIESLLRSTSHWQVIRIPGNPDTEWLRQEVEKALPSVLVIIQGEYDEEFPLPLQLIQTFSELKIITVNPLNNRIEVYNRQKIWIKEASDLLSIIEEDADSDRRGVKSTTKKN